MDTLSQRISFGLSAIFSTTVAAVFLFIAVGLVPYWQELSGQDVKDWFAGPFNRFSLMMVPVHFLSILTLGLTFVLHRKTDRGRLVLLALVALLVCQGFNFTLYGTVLNPALQSPDLPVDAALATLDRWDFFHTIRTFAVLLCVAVLFAATLRRKTQDRAFST